MRRYIYKATLFLLAMSIVGSFCRAGNLESVDLPKPRVTGGKPLMEVLNNRKSSRQFSRREIPIQMLSDMLWAAWGVNRPESGKRTAPSAVNWQEIDLYVASGKGLYLYDAFEHRLIHLLTEDIRGLTGRQDFVESAPINFIFVADYSRMGNASDRDKDFYAAADVGFISQNVYLFCASEGLATVVRGALNRDKLAEKMDLAADKRIILAQTVGYPIE